MRGKAATPAHRNSPTRITPAYAGKSIGSASPSRTIGDHPRLCGEKRSMWRTRNTTPGSPPPMRGKVPRSSVILDCVRITPAYAGKRTAGKSAAVLCRDHPRLCGEKTTSILSKQTVTGSPPPMRGKAAFFTLTTSDFRITPAYAGKSGQYRTPCAGWRDHPRLCGEKARTAAETAALSGSPPPMRGKVLRPTKSLTLYRITPAYAGKRV